ncbi:MAG: hypothetical protein AB7S46_01035 [Flavobacteriaceae bacterium]
MLAGSDGTPQARLGVYERVRDQLVAVAERSGRRISESAAAELVAELDAAIAQLEARYRPRPSPAARPAAPFPARAAPAAPLHAVPAPAMGAPSAPAAAATLSRPAHHSPAPAPAPRPPAAAIPSSPAPGQPAPAARPGGDRLAALLKAALDDELVRIGAPPVPAGASGDAASPPGIESVLPLPREAAQLRSDVGPLAIAALVLVAVIAAAAVVVASA